MDVLVSEWMGYCLFYEGMFDSVLKARFVCFAFEMRFNVPSRLQCSPLVRATNKIFFQL